MKSVVYVFAILAGVVVGAVMPMACDKDPGEEAQEAVKALNNGDPKQALEEAGEAVDAAAEKAGDAVKDATN